ncbi:hypothetical protein EMIT0P294_150095 [Pseudomonas sp. IT-P294]
MEVGRSKMTGSYSVVVLGVRKHKHINPRLTTLFRKQGRTPSKHRIRCSDGGNGMWENSESWVAESQ